MNLENSDAEYAARAAHKPVDIDLSCVIDAWPDLPDAIRAGILAMVRTAIE